ncbi:MAG: NHL repeat-containing protein [Bacteriovoracaceae bacterium]|nr:NHL repeat-containing protein [Bacteroidota bacterium]
MKNSLTILTVIIILAGCTQDENVPTQQQPVVPPWTSGQSAEAVFGQTTFTAGSTDSVGQNTIPGPWGLAVSGSGALFVVDQRGHRVLRYNNAATKASGANADAVFGQQDFAGRVWNYGAGGSTPSANGFETPTSVAVDPSGNLFVLDQANQRVLRFNNAASKTNGAVADGVLGQPDFVTKKFNTTQSGFFSPQGVAIDASGNLYVADGSNHRVLRFNNAASKANGAPADAVFGQPDFTTSSNGTSANKISNPTSLAVDDAGNLYVGERGNSRILVFFNVATKINGAAADIVLGKSDFGSGATPGAATAANVYFPYGLAVDGKKNLYVADGGFNRVLIFYNAPSKKNGDSADVVIGKKDFASSSVTGASVENIGQPYGIAVQSSTGKLYVSCYSNSRVLRFQAKSPLGQ